MEGIDSEDFINEIKFDIKENDLIKARAVLSFIGEVDSDTRKKVILEIGKADDNFVVPLLAGVLANTPDPGDAFEILKETLFSRVRDNPTALINQLEKEGKAWDRAFLVEVAGEIRLEESVPVLLKILNGGTNEKVIKASITALGLIGNPAACEPVSEYMYTGNMEFVVAAVKALGRIGSPVAVQRLKEKTGADNDLDVLILNALGKVQSSEALACLNETLGSHFACLRTTAKQKLVETGPKAVPFLINNLLSQDSDLLIHSLNILGDIGDEAAIPAIRKLLHNEPADSNVRFAAYEALGLLPIAKGVYTLAAGLDDPVDNVRTAAARAIDKNYNTALSAGMKNLIRPGDDNAKNITSTIIDAQCDNIFLSLVEENFFQETACQYLSKQAHPDITRYYINLLTKNGLSGLADRITADKGADSGKKAKVFAVDDSKMILNIYRSMLHKLGYESMLFEFPAEALEEAEKEKPDIIITDLNMPAIDGIEFTRKIRTIYSRNELPVIMVTTQNDPQDNEAAGKAGVSEIIHKPFTEKQIGDVLNRFANL
jgi:CheY-like chemotaxis protein/HEAT repeat protein